MRKGGVIRELWRWIGVGKGLICDITGEDRSKLAENMIHAM